MKAFIDRGFAIADTAALYGSFMLLVVAFITRSNIAKSVLAYNLGIYALFVVLFIWLSSGDMA